MNRRRLFLLVALLLASCTDVGPVRGPGTFLATLSSPNGDEGAAVLVLLGEGVVDVRGTGGTDAYAATSGETTRVVLIKLPGGTLEFEVTVADLGGPLSALVQEVAGPDDELRTDLSAYRVEFGR